MSDIFQWQQKQHSRNGRVRSPEIVDNPLSPVLRELAGQLGRDGSKLEDPIKQQDFTAATNRLAALAGQLEEWRLQQLPNSVYWVETGWSRSQHPKVTLAAAPIDVGPPLAEKVFRNSKTTVTPFVESAVLVTDGMYRISRNPMYLGFVLVLLGIAILLRSLTPFGVIPVCMAVIQLVFIQAEEHMLAAKFGKQYMAFAKNTRRWL